MKLTNVDTLKVTTTVTMMANMWFATISKEPRRDSGRGFQIAKDFDSELTPSRPQPGPRRGSGAQAAPESTQPDLSSAGTLCVSPGRRSRHSAALARRVSR